MKATWENAEAGDTIGKPKMKTKHTPGPLRIVPNIPVYGADNVPPLIEIQNTDPLDPRCVAWVTADNAQHVVRCWNSHEELLQACKAAASRLAVLEQGSQVVSMLDKAISKATGEREGE